MEQGESCQFIGKIYKKGGIITKLKIGDEVIIHPVPGGSKAEKSYSAEIVLEEYPWHGSDTVIGRKKELCLKGIKENINWHGAIINEYAFNRLEFVKRKI